MAIFRAGRKIFGQDVRIGISREDLKNLGGDPRLGRPPGSNPNTTINRFVGAMNEGEGFARKNKFYVEMNLPSGVSLGGNGFNPPLADFDSGSSSQSEGDFTEKRGFSDAGELKFYDSSNGRKVRLFCSAMSMPQREVDVATVKHNGPSRKFVTDHDKYENIDLTFYCDKFLRERAYFEYWQKAAINNESHNVGYYDEYVADMRLMQLGQFTSRQDREESTYLIKLIDAFPVRIGQVDYTYEPSTEVVSFNVTMQYRYWINESIDQVGTFATGKSRGEIPSIKGSRFGGLLGKLPAPIRRSARDFVNGLKRRVPYGRFTKGKIFPPFG